MASAGEFGVVKILVNDPDRTFKLLKEQNITVSRRRIIIAIIDDRPGGLHNPLVTLSSNKINIEDCYGFVLEDKKTAAIVVEVEKYPGAKETLKKHKTHILGESEVHSL